MVQITLPYIAVCGSGFVYLTGRITRSDLLMEIMGRELGIEIVSRLW